MMMDLEAVDANSSGSTRSDDDNHNDANRCRRVTTSCDNDTKLSFDITC
jgi:hypothetical protein